MADGDFSATNSLTNYINNSYQASPSSLDTKDQDAINKQLADLKLQFENGMKHLQFAEPASLSMKPSISMPQLPLFSASKSKSNKHFRKKPRPLTPSNHNENILVNTYTGFKPKIYSPYDSCKISASASMPRIQPSSTPSSTHSSSSPGTSQSSSSTATASNSPKRTSLPHAASTHDAYECVKLCHHGNENEINHKLDLLINIINSQQKLLENLMMKANETQKQKKASKRKKERKVKCENKGVQTMEIPRYVIQSESDSKQETPLRGKYPPIPEQQPIDSHSNITLPYHMLLKLVNVATSSSNKLPPMYPYTSSPPNLHTFPAAHHGQHASFQHPMTMNCNTYNEHHHIANPNNYHNSHNAMDPNMSPKSTLCFSDV
mmetsp:Transcript_41056/g.66045  ORF Transcript_41056/g.66045 Transcript_41056/m.66045 type:complete len:377 (+) Transcript_41056:65-1195(+)